MLADLEAFRKDPTLSFDYKPEDLPAEQGGEDEPTQYLPNVGVTRTRSQSYRPPVQEPEEEEEEERPRSNWWKKIYPFCFSMRSARSFRYTHRSIFSSRAAFSRACSSVSSWSFT